MGEMCQTLSIFPKAKFFQHCFIVRCWLFAMTLSFRGEIVGCDDFLNIEHAFQELFVWLSWLGGWA